MEFENAGKGVESRHHHQNLLQATQVKVGDKAAYIPAMGSYTKEVFVSLIKSYL
jgi:hypothetical protein